MIKIYRCKKTDCESINFTNGALYCANTENKTFYGNTTNRNYYEALTKNRFAYHDFEPVMEIQDNEIIKIIAQHPCSHRYRAIFIN